MNQLHSESQLNVPIQLNAESSSPASAVLLSDFICKETGTLLKRGQRVGVLDVSDTGDFKWIVRANCCTEPIRIPAVHICLTGGDDASTTRALR